MKSIDENDSNLNFTANNNRQKSNSCTENASQEARDPKFSQNCTKITINSESDDFDSDQTTVPPPDGKFHC